MRGKIAFVLGLGAGYVLGTRAGRERYEQIKEQAQRVWELPPVQKQVDKAKDMTRSALMAIPSALWTGAVKVTKAAASRGTAGQRLDAAIEAGEEAVEDLEEAVDEAKAAAKKPAPKKAASSAAAKKSTSTTAKKSTSTGAKKSTSTAKKRG